MSEVFAGREKIGTISAIQGASVTALLGSASAGQAVEVSIGGLVVVPVSNATLFGMVHELSAASATARQAEIHLLGEVMNSDGARFRRGISVFPGFDAPVLLASADDLAMMYAPPATATIRLGAISQSADIGVYGLTDDLLAKHFAILGTTGTGKSCTVSLILHAILEENPNGHILLIDPHNEYQAAFGDLAEAVNVGNLQLPYWLLNFEELVEVVAGGNRDRAYAETEILRQAVLDSKKAYLKEGERTDHITVDTPTPYRIGDIIKVIDDAMGKLERTEDTVSYLRLKAKIESLRTDRRYSFMFSRLYIEDTMAKIISRLLRIPTAGKPLTIVDISGVPSEVVDVVVSVLARLIFDFGVWSADASNYTAPVLLVCEEAHRYVPRDDLAHFGPSKKAISRIAKEGRKYGVGLCLVSQRPSELSNSALSQCSTIIALRMSNARDQQFVANALPESAGGLLNALPSLGQQEAIIVGDGVSIAMRMRFDNLPATKRPSSDSATFSKSWQADNTPVGFVDQAIERWRRQTHKT